MKNTLLVNMSEKEKFFKNLEQDIENGLVDTKFFPGNIFDACEEDLYAELNRMEEAQPVEVEMV